MWTNLITYKNGKKKRFHEAIEFFAIELFEKDVPDDLQIVVRFQELDNYGDSCILDYEDEFIIRINKNHDEETQLRTLAHEMVHVKQYMKNELRDAEGNYVIWHGCKLNAENYEMDLPPWEVEAYEYEDRLLEKLGVNNGRYNKTQH